MKEAYSFSEVFQRPDLIGTKKNAIYKAVIASNKEQRKVMEKVMKKKVKGIKPVKAWMVLSEPPLEQVLGVFTQKIQAERLVDLNGAKGYWRIIPVLITPIKQRIKKK